MFYASKVQYKYEVWEANDMRISPTEAQICHHRHTIRAFRTSLNSSSSGQNGRHFANDIFKGLFLE